jgi:hypothetical protein
MMVSNPASRVHAAVVELDPLADAVRPPAQDHHLAAAGGLGLALLLVRRVEVRGEGLELGGAGVDPLEDGVDPGRPAGRPGGVLGGPGQPGDPLVREAQPLGPPPCRGVGREPGGELRFVVDDPLHLPEEPRVDGGEPVDLRHGNPSPQGLPHPEDPVRAGHPGLLEHQHALGLGVGVAGALAERRLQAGPVDLKASQGLLQALLEGAPHRHDLAHRLHVRGEDVVGALELLEGEARHLGDHVVDGGLEGGRGLPGDVVPELVEGVSDGQLGRDLGDGEPGGLGGQRRAARDPRVHLDDHHPSGLRMHSELDVGAAGVDADLADDAHREVAEVLVLLVGEGLGRRHRDRVAGVDAHGIEVLDAADDHHVVVPVPHHLELVLLPAEDRLLHEDGVGGREVDGAASQRVELPLVVGNPAALSTHGETGPEDDREADLLGDGAGLLEGGGVAAAGHLHPDAVHGVLEELPVLGLLDGLEGGADELDAVPCQRTVPGQRHRQVERGLPPQRGEQHVGLFAGQDLLGHLRGDGLDVGPVGEVRVGHDRGRIGVEEDDLVALLLERLAGLGPRVVELAGLPDDDRSGADDHDLLDVLTLRHRGRTLTWGRTPAGDRATPGSSPSRRCGPRPC